MSRNVLFALSATFAAFFLVLAGSVTTLAFRQGDPQLDGAAWVRPTVDPAVASAPPRQEVAASVDAPPTDVPVDPVPFAEPGDEERDEARHERHERHERQERHERHERRGLAIAFHDEHEEREEHDDD